MAESPSPSTSTDVFRVLSYVNAEPVGPLSLTEINDRSVAVIGVLFNKDHVEKWFRDGRSAQHVIDRMPAMQRSVVQFPVEALREVTWFENRSDVTFRYESNGRTRKITSSIASSNDRMRLVEHLQFRFGDRLRLENAPPRILQVAWSNILGAILSLVGTWWLYANWDPVRIAQIQNGRLVLAIGREGCAAIGLAIAAGCCIYGWRAVQRHTQRFRCVVERDISSTQTSGPVSPTNSDQVT